ncbi:MAG: RDD family protein [Actinophytocola sp.]|uniref:RDD family protein n=1 Tax=Actinophytocola sp. TaxID=1872138 RepID=UPI001327E982|nr:RDD family protein [Actinophytocola sp.]MPZ81646.1 RDD family protein [Actinophytocola sp.]
MSRWTGSWLSGPSAAHDPDEHATQAWPGERLGLPPEGPGSVASRGARLVALLLDFVIAGLVTSLFVRMDIQSPEVMGHFNRWAIAVWFLISVGAISLFGFTAGMAALGIRAVRLDGTAMIGPIRAIPRAVLTAIIIPAAIWDADGRGLHDKAAGTIVLRVR